MALKAPKNFELLFTETKIQAEVQSLADQVDIWIKSLGLDRDSDVVAMPVMRGAMYFFSDLSRAMAHSVEIVPARTWGYTLSPSNEKAVETRVDLAGFHAKGKTILIVDEICDSGQTLKVLHEKIKDQGAKQIKTVTLIHRTVPNSLFTPDWVGFKMSNNDWLVGYGMDDNDRFRNLKEIYKKV